MIPCIKDALESDRGALIGRNGTIELEQMIQVTPGRLPILERNAGIFPIAVHSVFFQVHYLPIQRKLKMVKLLKYKIIKVAFWHLGIFKMLLLLFEF